MHRSRRSIRAAAFATGTAALSGALVACSLIVETSGLSGGDEGAREDAGGTDVSSVVEASTEDASFGPPDAGEIPDAHDASCPAPVAEDRFERSVDGGLGVADVGGPWTVTSSQLLSVKDGGATATVNAGQGMEAYLKDVSIVDADISFVLFADDTFTGPSSSALYITAFGRRTATGDDYDARLLIRPDGRFDTYLGSIVGGTQSTNTSRTNVSDLTFAPNRRFHVRMVVEGQTPTRVRLRIWQDGTAEPTGWTLEASDESSMLPASGSIGFKIYLSSAATSGPLTVTVDDLVVRTPCNP